MEQVFLASLKGERAKSLLWLPKSHSAFSEGKGKRGAGHTDDRAACAIEESFFEYIVGGDACVFPSQSESDIVQGDAMLVDAGARDHHIEIGSLGIDLAPAGGSTDLVGHPRDVGLMEVPNASGPRDIGAWERQPAWADTIFCPGSTDEPMGDEIAPDFSTFDFSRFLHGRRRSERFHSRFRATRVR